MNHPGNEVLLASIDGELAHDAANEVARHVDECDDCAVRLAHLRAANQALAGVIAGIDAREPAGWLAEAEDPVVVDAANVVPLRAPDGPRLTASPPRRNSGVWRWAAGIVLLAGAGTAAALLGRPEAAPVVTAIESADPTAAARAEPNVFHLTPVNGSMDVTLAGVAAPTRLMIAFGDDGDVAIEATGPDALHLGNLPGNATLDLGDTPATLRITYPRDLARGAIRVDDRVVARIVNGRLTDVTNETGLTITEEAADRS